MKLLHNIIPTLFLGLTSFQLLAVEVPGHFVYKMPAGELVVRDAILDVPPRGEGKVVLKYKDTFIESDRFRHRTVHGKVVFDVMFANPPGAPANTALVLTGAYLRGTNGVIYYGDAYTKMRDHDTSQQGQSPQDFDFKQFDKRDGHDWKYTGAFEFNTLSARRTE